MKYCKKCGAQMKDNAKFCPSCGAAGEAGGTAGQAPQGAAAEAGGAAAAAEADGTAAAEAGGAAVAKTGGTARRRVPCGEEKEERGALYYHLSAAGGSHGRRNRLFCVEQG